MSSLKKKRNKIRNGTIMRNLQKILLNLKKSIRNSLKNKLSLEGVGVFNLGMRFIKKNSFQV